MGTARKIKETPSRLERVFQPYDPPLYFVTINTLHRKPLLARQDAFDAFTAYARKNAPSGRATGRFVMMPDHIHLFVRIGRDSRLSDFVRLLKQALTKTLRAAGEEADVWQPGFFDRLLRCSESYSEKWRYVCENPVRAGLVVKSEEWPWQGEIERLEM